MKITFYTTDCPKCHVLQAKLDEKGLQYDTCNDVDLMLEKGMMSAPYLEVDGNYMDFGKAIKWVNQQ